MPPPVHIVINASTCTHCNQCLHLYHVMVWSGGNKGECVPTKIDREENEANKVKKSCGQLWLHQEKDLSVEKTNGIQTGRMAAAASSQSYI